MPATAWKLKTRNNNKRYNQWRIQTRRLGDSEIRERQKKLTCFNKPASLRQSLGITQKLLHFLDQENGHFSWSKYAIFQGVTTVKNRTFINSESLKQTSYAMWLFRGMLYSTNAKNFCKYNIFSSMTKFLRGSPLGDSWSSPGFLNRSPRLRLGATGRFSWGFTKALSWYCKTLLMSRGPQVLRVFGRGPQTMKGCEPLI